ncbi:MAG: outer membrane protein assembly factor BamE [Candidatus Nitrohelix vancouverensis]|uniref:Outer membrane protein assembly factor BamE n=1 Tax=Candidatus Nitrohelix vancouverensis TaxID=2705534 RepID=A0A7T0C577_9BACT|nr:MAG: outer membrane protein assembly factor BamE [Candidatus Nitrohelix vancouverensis]
MCLALVLCLGLAACGTTGQKFDENLFGSIENGKTTQKEILDMFGPPYQKGLENGDFIWVYEYNKYNLLSGNVSKDLHISFDRDGIVKSHQFMSN